MPILRRLCNLSYQQNHDSKAVEPPPEENRVPLHKRGVSLTFLTELVEEIRDISAQQFQTAYFLADAQGSLAEQLNCRFLPSGRQTNGKPEFWKEASSDTWLRFDQNGRWKIVSISPETMDHKVLAYSSQKHAGSPDLAGPWQVVPAKRRRKQSSIRLVPESNTRLDIDAGEMLNGRHTHDSDTDWRQFSRKKDEFCGKAVTVIRLVPRASNHTLKACAACQLHTGLSLVESCIMAGIVENDFGEPYFGEINSFVR